MSSPHVYCPVCQDILHIPYVIECGHTFCYECLFGWLHAHSSRQTESQQPEPTPCPSCRCFITSPPYRCLTLQNHIQHLLERDSKANRKGKTKAYSYVDPTLLSEQDIERRQHMESLHAERLDQRHAALIASSYTPDAFVDPVWQVDFDAFKRPFGRVASGLGPLAPEVLSRVIRRQPDGTLLFDLDPLVEMGHVSRIQLVDHGQQQQQQQEDLVRDRMYSRQFSLSNHLESHSRQPRAQPRQTRQPRKRATRDIDSLSPPSIDPYSDTTYSLHQRRGPWNPSTWVSEEEWSEHGSDSSGVFDPDELEEEELKYYPTQRSILRRRIHYD